MSVNWKASELSEFEGRAYCTVHTWTRAEVKLQRWQHFGSVILTHLRFIEGWLSEVSLDTHQCLQFLYVCFGCNSVCAGSAVISQEAFISDQVDEEDKVFYWNVFSALRCHICWPVFSHSWPKTDRAHALNSVFCHPHHHYSCVTFI